MRSVTDIEALLGSHAPTDAYARAELHGLRGGRAGGWVDHLLAFEDFVSTHGRLPQRTVAGKPVPKGELRVFDWMRRQRRRETSLTDFQRQRLELASLTWEPRDDHWKLRLREYLELSARLGRTPSRRSADPTERSLALWSQRQQTLGANGRLGYSRLRALEQAAPRIDET